MRERLRNVRTISPGSARSSQTRSAACVQETTPEATARAICRRVASLTGVVAAQLALFELDGRAWPIGFVVDARPDPPARRRPEQRSRNLRERAAEGSWIE